MQIRHLLPLLRFIPQFAQICIIIIIIIIHFFVQCMLNVFLAIHFRFLCVP